MPVIVEGRWVVFNARGHVNIRATHKSTFEITKEPSLTPRGDCIIGVSSELAAADLPEWLKEDARSGSLIIAVLEADGYYDVVVGKGDSRMTLDDPVRMVFRRSDYVGPETVMIQANKAARDLDRRLVQALASGSSLRVAITTLKL